MIERDKRIFERVPAMIDVAYRVHKEEDYNRTVSKDISGGGINLSLNERLNPGTLLELKITLPDVDSSIAALGKVI